MSVSYPSARKRVAFISRRFGKKFGGAEAYGEHVMNELRQTHDVHVFCQEWDSPLDLPHTLVPRRRGLPRWLNLLDFTRRCQALTRGFDVVHSHENSWLGNVHVIHVMPVRYAKFHNGRTFGQKLSTCLSLRWLAYLGMEALCLRPRPGSTLVAASSLIAEQVQAAYRVTAPCTVIVPGVNIPDAVQPRADARRSLGLDPDHRYGVLVANDPMRKGLAVILEAMTQLPDDFHLIVVGGEGGMPQRVQEAVAAAGMFHRVHVWAGCRDVNPFYAAADLCVFPTLGDAFGMVPLEAMAHRLPVVLSNPSYCGFAHHVRHDVEAILLNDPRDAGEVARAVQSILQDTGLASRLAGAGHALAASFSWAAVADCFSSLYVGVAASSQAGGNAHLDAKVSPPG